MRILWFTNSPGLISGRNNNSNGWVSSLQQHVEENGGIELGLIFYSDYHRDPFRDGSTHYFPVVRMGNTRLKRKLMQLFARTAREENIGEFLEIIQKFKPDLIHIHGTENPFGLIIPHVKGIPVLVSLQSILNVILKKYFSGIDSFRFTDWRKNWDFFLARNYTIFKKRAAIEREILSSAQFIAGRTNLDRQVSRVLAPQAEYFHLDESLRPVFYNSRWEVPGNKKFRLFTTLLDLPYKGVQVLCESAIELHQAGFEFEWHVAGLDWGSDMLRTFHREKELAEVDLHLRGMLSENDIVGELLKSDCFVQVSQIENSSNSLSEAMMLGVPCIATAAGGTFSMLRDGIEGILVPEGDPFSLAGCIIEYSARYEELIEMGQRARLRALDRHAPDAVLKQLMLTYDAILARYIPKELYAV